jgi:hypothetical protein
MVRIVLDLHEESHAIFATACQAPVADVFALKGGVQLMQIASREPHVYPVANDRCEHVFLLLKVAVGGCLSSGDARFNCNFGSTRSGLLVIVWKLCGGVAASRPPPL